MTLDPIAWKQLPLPLRYEAAERLLDPATEQDHPEEFELQPAQSPHERRAEWSPQPK